MTADGFSASMPTQSGCVYRLEYKNSLAETDRATLPPVAGAGHERTLTDPPHGIISTLLSRQAMVMVDRCYSPKRGNSAHTGG
jgi:hypothetical protein